MKIRIIMFALMTVLFTAGSAGAQVFTDYWYGSVPDAGMGGASTASSGDIWSPGINPAGLSGWNQLGFAADYSNPSAGGFVSNTRMIAAAPLPGRFGTVALAGEIGKTSYMDHDLSSEMKAGFSHAFFLQKDLRSSLAFGYNVNYLQVDYGTHSAGTAGDGSNGVSLGSSGTIGIDVGFRAGMGSRAYAGFFLKNLNRPELGSSGTASALPRKLSAGIAYNPYYGLVTAWSIEKLEGRDAFQVHGGLEYSATKWLVLRSGISHEPSQFTLGLGIRTLPVHIDYALITHPVLPVTHMFSMNLQLNGASR